MIRSDELELENSNAAPYEQMIAQEFVDGMLKAGSLISIIENKKINTTTLFSLLVEKTEYQEFFTEMTSSNSFREALAYMLHLNPNLVKSKITKSLARKANGKSRSNNRVGKTAVQQTPSGVTKRKKQTL